MVKQILVVGGGIAGLSLSIALAKQGLSPSIVERDPQWGVYGVGIILQSNALRALDTMGLAERCLAQGYPYSTTRYCDHNGVVKHERTKPNLSGERWASSTGILRPALHQILRDEVLRLGVPVRLGVTVADIVQDDGAARVTFSDGSSGTYDLVVGADGVRSQTRRMAFGEAHSPTFMGQACWRFTAPRPAEVSCALMFRGQTSLAGLIPLNNEQMYLLLLTAEPGNPRIERGEMRDMLSQRLAGYGGIIGELARTIPEGSAIVYSPLEPLLMPLPWHRQRVVLIGDAVHATTPHIAQGASMALEDAVVLAELLAGSEPVESVLQQFTARRYRRCRTIVENSLQIGKWQLMAWAGRPDPNEDVVGLSNRTLEMLREPI